MPHHYTGIDLGAESGRVMLGTLDAGRLALDEIHRFPNGPVRLAGTLRWDLLRIWEEIKHGLRETVRRGIRPASLGVDSWALDYVLMRGGEPLLRPPYCYRDARTAVPYEDRHRIGEAAIYDATGIQFMPINTLYHLLADLREDPALLASADRFLMIGDWFHFLLTGCPVQEESNASTTQLWDPRRRAWSESLIAAAGLPRHIFPEVVPPCTLLGKTSAALEMETGLPQTPVIAGCVHDTGAAYAAVPAGDDPHWACISSGTWSLIGTELPAPHITDAARAANFTNETGIGGTSRFLRNAGGLWLLQECRRAWQREGRDIPYEELTRLAAAAPPRRSLIPPAHPDFLRPADMPGAIRDYCRRTGQPLPETPGQSARCVLDSLALHHAEILTQLEAVTSRRVSTLHIVGGGSKNDLLNQLTADATGRTVVAGPAEATVAGNILLQALALGHIASARELRAIVRASFPLRTFTPGG